MCFLVSFLTLALLLNLVGMSSFSVQNGYSYTLPSLRIENGSNNTSKLVILAFDDSPKSQFTLAKPILDKCGFKGPFLQSVLLLIMVLMVQIKHV